MTATRPRTTPCDPKQNDQNLVLTVSTICQRVVLPIHERITPVSTGDVARWSLCQVAMDVADYFACVDWVFSGVSSVRLT